MRKSKTKDYQTRDKFFYAVPQLFPRWDYPSRYAIGVNLDDFSARNAPYYRFRIKNTLYQIPRDRAEAIGRRHVAPFGKMPHLIPKECFDIIEDNLPTPIEYDFDMSTNTAFIRGSRPIKLMSPPKQEVLL